MLASQRKDYLLQILQTQGQIVAKDVSRELELSEDTIRRDLRELAAAGRLQRVHGGALPASEPELLALPGIGRYTAGAVRSFAFRQDAPILDTNVLRLLVRVFAPPVEGGGAALLRRLWALAEAVIPPGQGYVINQALMDFGAQVCTARRPICLFCPLRPICGRWNPRPEAVSYEA